MAAFRGTEIVSQGLIAGQIHESSIQGKQTETLPTNHVVPLFREEVSQEQPDLLRPVEVMVGEVHEGIPVVGGDVVLARSDVIADGAHDELPGAGVGIVVAASPSVPSSL